MSAKWDLIKGWYVNRVDGLVQFCVDAADGEFYSTRLRAPAIQKNGNFDRFWLIKELKYLQTIVRCGGISGTVAPRGITYVSISPTTGVVEFRR